MSQRPFVSVIIPVYNGESFITEVIATVKEQNYDPIEIIIIDDGSTDRSGCIAKGYVPEIRYYRQDHRGPSAARNLGIKNARGDVFAFLDVDDLWPADKLLSQIACLQSQPDLGMVGGYAQFMRCVSEAYEPMIFEEIWSPHFVMNLGGAIIKRSVFELIGYFDEQLFLAEDVNWLLRAFEHKVPIGILKQVTLYYRKHPRGVSFGRDLRSSRFIAEIKKSLDRRRTRDSTIEPIPNLRYCEMPGKPIRDGD